MLGAVESGVDFEKRIFAICQQCRTPEAIDAAFAALRAELEEQIRARLDDTRRTLFEHFDEDVHQRLRLQLADARARLDRVGRRFWLLTRCMLGDDACFDDAALAFDLVRSPRGDIPPGRYQLISKTQPQRDSGDVLPGTFLYRLSHPLGEHVVEAGKRLATPAAHFVFDMAQNPARSHAVEALRGKNGYLTLARQTIDSYEREEYLLFSGIDDQGESLDQETMEKLFHCAASSTGEAAVPHAVAARLAAESRRHAEATVSRSLEANNRHFRQAREKLQRWADDLVLAAEKALRDTKERIKALEREARHAATLAEQHRIQEEIQKLEKVKRRQRQDIFKVEDDIIDRRDALIDALEKRLAQRTETETLFTVRWSVV